MSLGAQIRDEQGTTLVELMVGLMVGLVVLSTLTAAIVVTLHSGARVSARVDATQRARVVLAKIIENLHSACVSPKIAPIREESTGTSLSFIHAAGSEGPTVAPNPTLSVISLEGDTLWQSDYAASGTPPDWEYSSSATKRKLMTGVGPVQPSSSIFSYYAYSGGKLSETPLPTPLNGNAALTIAVRVALTTRPGSTPVDDSSATASIQDSATLRLTPPSFNEQATSLPCQ